MIDNPEFMISGGYEAISAKTDFDGRHRLNSATWYQDPLLGFAGPIVVVEAHNDDFLTPTAGTAPTDNSSAVAISGSTGQLFARGELAAGLGWDHGDGWVTLTLLRNVRGDLSIRSSSPNGFADWLGDRLRGSIEIRNVKLGSIDVAVIAYDNTDRMIAGWVAGDLIFELRGNFDSLDSFTDALLDIKVVDEDTWQSIASDVEFYSVFPGT